MANNYSLILSAIINEKQLNAQLNRISKDHVFNLKAKLDFSDIENQIKQFKSALGELQKQAEKSTPSGNGSKTRFIDTSNDQKSIEALQKRINDIRSSVDKAAKYRIFTGIDEDGEKIRKAVINYTDGMGKAVQETLVWKTTTEQVGNEFQRISKWQVVSKNYTDDIARAEKKHADEVRNTNKEMEKMTLYADKVLERSKNMGKSRPEVTKAIDLANQLKTELGANGLTDRAKNLYHELQSTDAAVRALGKSTLSWGNEVKIAIRRTIEWAGAIGLVYGAIRQLREGIEYIRDLNKELTNIQVVTGFNDAQIGSLATRYNALAKEMGATTLEISASATEWYRQGKTVQETEELIRSSMMMSKLAAIESSQATEYMTSILNGFQMSADESVSVLDKLISVDNAAATSTAELAEGLRRSANSAQQAGVGMSDLISYIGTVSSVSRRSAESIGESLCFLSI